MEKIYVRVASKKESETFWRCAMQFSRKWRYIEVDAATKRRLEQEQMLEVSETKPADLEDDAPAGDSAAVDPGVGEISAPPATAPVKTEADAPVGRVQEVGADPGAVQIDPVDTTDVTAVASDANAAQAETSTADAAAATVQGKPGDPVVVGIAIRNAVAQLDKENGELWTAGGKPTITAITALTGWPVTAAERDAALVEVTQ